MSQRLLVCVYERMILPVVLCALSTVSAWAGTNAVYLAEGFDALSLPAGWNVQRITGAKADWMVVGSGTHPVVAPLVGAGQAQFNSYDAAAGEQARLISPAFDLSTAVEPFVEFWMYHDTEFNAFRDSVYVEVSTNDSIQGPWTTLLGVSRPRSAPGWMKEAAPLGSLEGISRVFVAFRGASKYGNNMFMDEVRVLDSTLHDIGAVAFLGSSVETAPQAGILHGGGATRGGSANRLSSSASPSPSLLVLAEPSTTALQIVVQNFGTFSESMYSVEWRIDDQAQTSAVNSRVLAIGQKDTLALPWAAPLPGWHEIAAWTVLPSDSNRSNDTVRLGVRVLDSTVVFSELFNGEQFPPPGWSVINRDGGVEEPWFRGSVNSAFEPYEGAGFAADNFQRANGSYLDDYLISPPLPNIGASGFVDSVIFWTRSVYYTPPAINYPDSLMILVSTSGSDTSDFSTILEYFAVPKGAWTRKAYALTGTVPENSTVRVAFRYFHFDAGGEGRSADFVGVDAVQLTRAAVTSISEHLVPGAFALSQNYPNPFNPTTEITYEIAEYRDQGSGASIARLVVYDLLGREVATLVNGTNAPGSYTVRFDASGLASGMYLYRLTVGNFVRTRKMLLLK